MAGGDLLGERALDEARRHLQQRFRERDEFVDRQAAMPIIHRLGERCEMPARTRIIAVLSIPSRIAIWSALLKPMPRISRASRYGSCDISLTASAP